MGTLFPFSEYWWFYLAFTGFVLVLLALDLGVFHRKAHAVSNKEAVTWSIIWIALALLFNFLFYKYSAYAFADNPRLTAIPGFDVEQAARAVGLEFLTGFIVEKSLAVDNIFVFVLIFNYLAIPLAYQHRVLFYGIIGALIFRAIFIAMGSVLLEYHIVVYIFGAFLILTGIKMMFTPDKGIEPDKNPLVRLLRRFFPITPTVEGERFFLKRDLRWYATPLMVALVLVEFSDIIFAVDSVPAIFAITKEPLIVFTSNVFAILGLRALYFLLANIVNRFHLLKYGLALVLIFVGLKMVWLNNEFDGKFPITWSLGIIVGIIAISVILSWKYPKKETAR
ncbi:MAG: TerC family protein [bacterium]|nr:TerC family protein [bacterium]